MACVLVLVAVSLVSAAVEERMLEDLEPHRKLAAKLESRLVQRLSHGLEYGLAHARLPSPSLLRDMDDVKYLMVQLLHALDSGDMPYSNIVMESLTEAEVSSPDRIYDWLNSSFAFDRKAVFRSVKNYIRWFSYFPYPRFVSDIMVFLARDYSLVELLSPKQDLETIRWLLKSRFDVGGLDVGIVEGLWDRGAKDYLDSSLSSRRKESLVDYIVGIGDIDSLIYLIESNITDVMGVVLSCLRQNSSTMTNTFLPMLIKHNLSPQTVDSLFQTVLNDSRFDILVKIINIGFPINRADYNGVTLLYKAIEYNNTKMIDFLLRAGADVNFTSGCNVSLLHKAVERGKEDVVQTLLDLGADLYAKDCEENTAMHVAVKSDNEEMILFLVENNFDLNFKSDNGENIIFFAIANGTERSLKYLINLGCDVNAVAEDKGTPLLLALLLRKQNATSILVENGARINYTTPVGNTLMHLCAMKGSVSGINALRSLGMDIDDTNIDGETPLYKAVEYNKPDVIKTLLQSGADYTVKAKNGDSLLHIAVVNHAIPSLRLLLKKEVIKPDIKGHGHATPMERAVRLDDTEAMSTLRLYGADVKRSLSYEYKSTLLHDAARYGCDKAVSWLLDNGLFSPDVKQRNGWTALHWATKKGHVSTVKVLVEHKANVDAKDDAGITPLFEAARRGFAEIVQDLLKAGANVTVQMANGYSALHIASLQGHHAAVHELLEWDPEVDAQTDSGNTALHLAAWKGHLSIVQDLLASSANPNLTTKSGYAPLHVAVIFGRLAVVQELIANKADVNAMTRAGWTPLSLAKQWKHKAVEEEIMKHQQ